MFQPLLRAEDADTGLPVVDAKTNVKQMRDALRHPFWPQLIRAARRKLQLAVPIILLNAYKYSPNGGSVQLRFRHQPTNKVERVGIDLTDQGIGMAEAQRSQVCKRF